MIKAIYNLENVKKRIGSYFGSDVELKVNLGRNKMLSFSGKLTGVYPALFTVSPDNKSFTGKTSYAYSEILCGNVVIEKKKA